MKNEQSISKLIHNFKSNREHSDAVVLDIIDYFEDKLSKIAHINPGMDHAVHLEDEMNARIGKSDHSTLRAVGEQINVSISI